MYLSTEYKVFIGLFTAVMLFFASAIHTNVHEAEKKIEQDFGIEAELNFEKDADKANIFEQLEQQRTDMYYVTYSVVR